MLYPIGIQNFEKLRDGDYIYVVSFSKENRRIEDWKII